MSTLAWKVLHHAGVVLFLGNIITGLFWAAHARRTRDPRSMAVIFDGLIRTDRWFTLPCVVVVLISGIALAGRYGLPVAHTGWLLWSSASFALSGLLFGAWLAPWQLRIREASQRGSPTPSDIDRLFRKWEYVGIVSIGLVALAFFLMLTKPDLPSL